MKFSESPGIARRQRLKELDGGCHYDGRPPKRGKLAGVYRTEVGPVMMLSHNGSRIFTRKCDRFPKASGRLGDDIGEGRDDKKPAQAILVGLSQKVSGDGVGLPQAHGRLARDNGLDQSHRVTGLARGVQLLALSVATPIPSRQGGNVVVEGSYSFFPACGGWVQGLAERVVVGGVLVVGIYKA
jgi:hypothetical protein